MKPVLRMSEPQSMEDLKPRLRELRAALANHDADRGREIFASLDRDMPAMVDLDQQELLENMIAWDDGDFSLAARIHSLYARMAEASQVLAALPARAADRVATLDLIASAMGYWCQAAKWELISGNSEERQGFVPLHGLYKRASVLLDTDAAPHLTVSGSPTNVSIDGLYVRALVLRRLSGGHLGAQQIEILDSWLLAWMPSMHLESEDPAPAPRLVVQPDSNVGLVREPRERFGAALYLRLEPLKAALDGASDALQQGDLFPGWGPATTFRLEEHVAVLDALDREFRPPAAGAMGTRDERSVDIGKHAQVFVGLGEIIRDGFSAEPAQPALEFSVRDHNEWGIGLEASREAAVAIQPGDILGVRCGPSATCVVCEVVRKLQPPGASEALLGLRVLCHEALPLRLKREKGGAGQLDVDAIYMPGADSSGHGDSLLVSEGTFESAGVLVKKDPPLAFRITLNRARRMGRGWVLAGLEFLAGPERAAEPAVEPAADTKSFAPGLTLTLME